MGKCPNCGRKTKGDYCQWCDYPLRKRRWFGRRNGQRHLRKLIKQSAKGELKIEQIIKEASKIIKKEADEESAKIITEQLAKAIEEQAKREAKEKAKREAEQIIREFIPKAPEKIEQESPAPMIEPEEATEQTTQPTLPSQAHLDELNDSHLKIAGRDQTGDKIRVLIIDRQIIFYEGIRLYLSRTPDIAVIGNSEDFTEDALTMVEKSEPDVVLVDINPPSLNGIDLARRIAERLPMIPVIMLTPYDNDDQTLEALKTGVAGYLGKDINPDELADAIRRVFKGERIIINVLAEPRISQKVLDQFQDMMKATKELAAPLSPEEEELLGYFAHGYSGRQISHAMSVSDETINNSMSSIILKLIANERTE